MNKFSIFIIAIMGLLMQSCVWFYTGMTHISPDEMKWMGDYKILHHDYWDMRLFKSQYSEIDTMLVFGRCLANSLSPLYISLTPFEKFSAGAYVLFSLSSFKDNQGIFYIERPIETGELLFDMYFIGGPRPGMEFANFTYDNQVYENCLISTFENFKVNKLVWYKGTGLIYYSLADGREFFFTGESLPDPRFK